MFKQSPLSVLLKSAAFGLAVTTGTMPVSNLRADSEAMATYGVCAHLTWHSDNLQEIDDLAAAGVKWVRFGAEWGSVESAQGVPNNTKLAQIDDIVNRLNARGINIIWPLGFTATWASSAPASVTGQARAFYRPVLWSDWEKYVTDMTTRYNNKVTYWEVWNEQDYEAFLQVGTLGGDVVSDYNEILQRASTIIRAANPNNKVVLGGLALCKKENGQTVDNFGPGTFLDLLLAKPGAKDAFDIMNYHAYGPGWRWSLIYNAIKTSMNNVGIGSKKIWITETGYSSLGVAADEVTKADRVDQAYLLNSILPGVERSFWYLNRNTPPLTPASPSEENFGLQATDRTPLKAMAYYQAEAGARTDFYLQQYYPTQSATLRTLYYVPATSGDGSSVTNYNSDPSIKQIAASTYMYLRVNDNWIYDSNAGMDTDLSVEVTYLDTGTGSFAVQYDKQSDPYAPIWKTKTNAGYWTTATFLLSEVKFANRQNNASDLRIAAVGDNLVVSKVVVRKQMNKARIYLGTNQRGRLLEQPVETVTTNPGYTTIDTQGGETCRKVQGGYNNRIYLQMSDGTARVDDPNVTFGVRFWDSGTDTITIFYNAIGNADKQLTITKTNTNAWKYVQVAVNDAAFNNAFTYKSDLSIGTGGSGAEYVSRVDVTLRRATAVIGGIDRFRLITQTIDPVTTNIGYVAKTTMGGAECYQIQNNSKYMFFLVSKAFVSPSGPNVTFGVKFWDSGTDSLQIRYNASGNAYKGITIAKTNTNTWRYVEVPVTDAAFSSSQSYFGDFSIGNNGDNSVEHIASVSVIVP